MEVRELNVGDLIEQSVCYCYKLLRNTLYNKMHKSAFLYLFKRKVDKGNWLVDSGNKKEALYLRRWRRKSVDVVRDEVKERPKQPMSRNAPESTDT